ncbi:hypothetical protein L1F30_08435 [Simiduia sp. 21SJ11W-1]|uniref:hypothetical protein n=1 Tax=Simiduia sp. 21SJ11W-1 TaxID=2909669 RepID=UPI00209EA000|nr:hypothetical protein [Simiduia sp. 21SJ11W-1]UTA49551.1 hypothetical protein L1F30_08435 [Simiduia sp. 21SJ11W-1]
MLTATNGAPYLGCGLGVALLAFTSWRDDTHPLSPQLRLLVQLISASLACLPLLFSINVNPLWGAAVVLGIMWLINLYNFMDGTDALAGAQGLIFTLGVLMLFPEYGSAEALLLIVTSSAITAFLIFNWPPAKIFMGDVGSTVLGLIFGFITLQIAETFNQLAACLILLAGFITDASWTLAARFLNRQRVWEAHRLHYYQKMARKFASHKAPLATYLLLGALVQWPLALGALHATSWYWTLYLLAAITIHALLCWQYRAGLTDPKDCLASPETFTSN